MSEGPGAPAAAVALCLSPRQRAYHCVNVTASTGLSLCQRHRVNGPITVLTSLRQRPYHCVNVTASTGLSLC